MTAMNDNKTKIKVLCSIEQIRFFKNQFGIILCSIDNVISGTPKIDKTGLVIFKGTMPEPIVGDMYNITAEYVEDKKWGGQYNILTMYSAIVFKDDDIVGQKKFLASIFTPLQVESMYNALSNPFLVLKDNNFTELVKVKGCGMTVATRWIERFNENFYIGKIYTELEQYNLTNNMIKKLISTYGSPDLIIDKVRSNPYVLCNEVKGVGWKTADKIALDGGLDPYSTKRISAYIIYYLDTSGENGCSWITPDELMGAILEELGDDTPDANITQSIHELGDKLWWNEDKTQIGLRKYYNIEYKIAEELIRLQKAKSDITCENWEDIIKHMEYKQGWEFTEEQKQGIAVGLQNNVTVITGSGGTGKSSLVAGILEVLKNYSFAQCALSGRASSRLTEVTGTAGYTIHRLLGYPCHDDTGKNGFTYHDENQLPYDIIIIDEISMIDGFLFFKLLRAIKSGAKVFLLGDVGQLEAIGCCNVAFDMIASTEIPTVTLTQIHRQAAKSAIITESIKVRHGQQLVNKDWIGVETRGELQDLTLDCYSDQSNTYYKIMQAFAQDLALKDFHIMDTQIIVPIKTKGTACTYELNNAIQELCNPSASNKKEYTAFMQGKPYILREGDKVINTANNYKVEPPIFNGNIGIIQSIGLLNEACEEVMIINFMGIGNVELPKKFWDNIELAYAITVHKCVTGDTYIYTKNGLKQIKELDNNTKTGDYLKLNNIEVYNGTNMETASHFYNAGVSECRKLTTSRGYELTATLEHGINILNSNGDIVRRNIEDLTIGDNIIVIKGQKIFGNKIDLPTHWKKFNIDTRTVKYILPNSMTTDFAKFLGYMVGDGCVANRKIQFGKNQLEVAEDFAKLLLNIFNYKVKNIRHLEGKLGGMRLIEVASKFITEYCKKISGIQPHHKFVPECVLNAPMECQCAFLSGLFEDGTVNVKKGKFDHIEFSTSELQLCKQIRMMLLNLGIGSTYKTIHANNGHVLYIYKRDAQEFMKYIRFTSFEKQNRLMLCNRVEKHSSERKTIPYIHSIIMLLQNKYNLRLYEANPNLKYAKGNNGITYNMLNVFLDYYKNTEVAKDGQFKKLQFVYDNCIIDPIINLEDTVEQTYCLTMPETHQFVQNGIWGWNCQGSEFNHIIFGIDFMSYSLLSKEIVYTGITRAKKKCTLIAQTGALRMAVSKEGTSKKQTHLQQCLYNVAHPKLIF